MKHCEQRLHINSIIRIYAPFGSSVWRIPCAVVEHGMVCVCASNHPPRGRRLPMSWICCRLCVAARVLLLLLLITLELRVFRIVMQIRGSARISEYLLSRIDHTSVSLVMARCDSYSHAILCLSQLSIASGCSQSRLPVPFATIHMDMVVVSSLPRLPRHCHHHHRTLHGVSIHFRFPP